MIQKEFIRNELKYRYPDLNDHITHTEQTVGRPLLFEGGERSFGARIIIATAQDLLSLNGKQQSEPLFLIVGNVDENIIEKYDVCVLPSGEQLGSVFNFIQRLFDRLDDWTQSLRQAAETGEGVNELLSRASAMLQNPVYLLDERRHVVAASEHSEEILTETMTVLQGFFEELDFSKSVQKRFQEGAPEALLSSFRSDERSFLLIGLASERALYASDEIVFASLAGFLRLMLSERTLRLGITRKTRDNEAAANLFRVLLTQERAQQDTLDSLVQLGWSDVQAYAVLSMEPKNKKLLAGQADAICDQFEVDIESSCAFTLLPAIVAIVPCSLMGEASLVAKLNTMAVEKELNIGVCEPFDGLTYMQQRREQSLRALDQAHAHGGICLYSNLFEEEFSKNVVSEFVPELLCMRSVRAMAQYDLAHGTNYLLTAELYVKNRFNAVKTAGEMFIHRSTFLYRLERIREQFGLNMDDVTCSVFHLTYSFIVVRT